MTKFFNTIMFLLITVSIHAQHTKDIKTPEVKHTMLKGCIYSSQLEDIPPFNIYFQGIQTTSNDDGFFI